MPAVMLDQTGRSGPQPHSGGQVGFAEDWVNHRVAAEGGWFSGKTFIGARKLVTLHMHNAFDAEGDTTCIPSAVLAPTYQNILDFDLPEILTALREANCRADYRPGMQAVMCHDLGTKRSPSLIMLRSAEQPGRIAGWQVGAGWGDEATRWPESRLDPTRDAYLQFQSRVRHPRANFCQLILTYTNEGDTTRMFEEFHPLRPGHALYRLPTRENPVAQTFIEQQSRILNADLVRQYLGGEAVNFRGKRAYDGFDEARNVSGAVALAPGLPLQIGVDFNISPGMHIVVGQHDPGKDTMWVTHEIHKPRMNLREAVRTLQVLIADLGGWHWPELQVFADATGSSAWAGTGESCHAILHQGLADMGMPFRFRVPRSNPLQTDRINAMNIAMLDLRGQVHWQCHPRCELLIRDLKAVKTDDHGDLDKKNRDLTHVSDAEGYRVEYLRPARRPSRTASGGRIGYGE